MIKIKSILILLAYTLMVSFVSCKSNNFKIKTLDNHKCVEVSPNQLYKYNHRLIEIEGYLGWGFELAAIFPSKKDFDNRNAKTALWLGDLEPATSDSIQSVYYNYLDYLGSHSNGEKVVLTGYIDTSIRAPIGLYMGGFNYLNIRKGSIGDCQ